MYTATPANPVTKKVVDALQAGDKNACLLLFAADARLIDDGNKIAFKGFSANALWDERFTSAGNVENEGLSLSGRFLSDKWDDSKKYVELHIIGTPKNNRL